MVLVPSIPVTRDPAAAADVAAARDGETQLSKFSQTLQHHQQRQQARVTSPGNEEADTVEHEKTVGHAERSRWLTTGPEPPSTWREVADYLRGFGLPSGCELSSLNKKPVGQRVACVLKAMFPVLQWCRSYKITQFKNDLMSGLTLASLCIPQSIGYATLAKLDPQYGLYTSVVPPLIYAVMGTSKELAIGPVAVVSMLISSMVSRIVDPGAEPALYRNLVFTATFFAGVFQAVSGLLRLGFLVDFLSHATLVGFMAGAAVIIGFQQMKGLLGIAHFTNRTDVVSVVQSVWRSFHHDSWNPYNFLLGSAFLSFILITRFLGRRNKKFFFLAAISPLISVILATVFVFVTRADEHGVKIIKHIKGGLNPISAQQLQFSSPHIGEVARVGLIIGAVALTEAMAVGRSFAAIKGYHLDGNKEMVAMGFTNMIGSITSCYTATGSFSRTAVNFSAGCETPVSNIVMAITVLMALELFTRLLYYTPTAILASIILAALPGLVDLHEAFHIWKVDKMDFLACIGAFVGVLFISVEIGLLVAVAVSFLKIILISIQPGIETLGRLPGTDTFCNVDQYPMAITIPCVMVVRVKSSLLCFANANFIKERIMQWIRREDEGERKIDDFQTTQLIILDLSNLVSIDTSGIASLEELHKNLVSLGVEMAIVNPKWEVTHKLRLTNLMSKIGGKVFLTIKDAIDACPNAKLASI
ncbi:STAS domain-containing protein [Psidium guajava]|nr:STAS domain-containing protein [Psidium guajava]